jgi:hypothetical protein
MKGPLSLHSQLSLTLGGLSLLFLTVVGVYLGRVANDEIFAGQQADVRAVAQSAAELLATQMRNRETEIVLLSQAPHLVDGALDSPLVRGSLQRRQALNEEFAWMGVATPDGTVVQSTGGLLVAARWRSASGSSRRASASTWVTCTTPSCWPSCCRPTWATTAPRTASRRALSTLLRPSTTARGGCAASSAPTRTGAG